jgi:hypothetical protein
VVSTSVGSPELVVDGHAHLLTRHARSPFGALLSETDERIRPPLGFAAGIEEHVSGVVVLRGRPYDSHTGQWMTPIRYVGSNIHGLVMPNGYQLIIDEFHYKRHQLTENMLIEQVCNVIK